MPTVTKVAEIMTKNVFSVDIDDTVLKADEIMKSEHIRHVPVMEGKRIVGLINDRKIMEYTLRGIYEHDQNFGDGGFNKIIDFEKIMTPVTHVTYPEDSIAKAVKLMVKYHLDCIPVVNWDMHLEGILTTTDLLLFFHQKMEAGEFA